MTTHEQIQKAAVGQPKKRVVTGETAVPAPARGEMTAEEIQRTYGNRAAQRILQAKLKLGPAGDSYEQEADKVAQQVVNNIHQPQPVQRQEGEEEELQAKPLAEGIQRIQRQEDEDELMAKRVDSAVQREGEEDELMAKANHGMEGGDVDTGVAEAIESARGGGQALAEGVRSSMEQGFGADFSGVRIHTGGQAEALNRSLNARAFTTGNNIFFGQGQYNPTSREGQELLAHELTHTVQQGAAEALPIQRAWDVASTEQQHPKAFAALLEKMHEIPMFRRSIITELAAVTDSPGQLDELIKRVPATELKVHLANFPHAALLKRIVYLCSGPSEFNKIMGNITNLNAKEDVVSLLNENGEAGLTEIESIFDTKRVSEGLKAANGTIISKITVDSFKGEHFTAVRDALNALDGTKERNWGGKWGDYHGNEEGNLPGVAGRGGYKEYYVRPGPLEGGWGGRRLVVHNATKRVYYTWTHYGEQGKPAFVRIR